MPFNQMPYTDLHEINLNKFLKAIKNLLGGHGGEFLKKKSNIPFDYEWANVEASSGVNSVNGKTGTVVLDASDVGALPDSYTPPPAPVQSVNGQTGAVSLDYQDVGALPDTYTPPPAPVQSVNGQTGAVSLDYQDVGALPDTYTPPPAPVQSVNGHTGAVTIREASPATEFALSSGTSGVTVYGKGIYDPNSSTVRIYIIARSSNNIGFSTVLATVPQQYRPAQQTLLYGAIATNNIPFAYLGHITAPAGNIYQELSSTAKEVFLTGEYKI